MITYPNQKIVHLNKRRYENRFCVIGIDDIYQACRELNTAELKLYLYVASNSDGFDLALSQKAVQDAIGLSKATYHRAFNGLEEKGYIKLKQGNIYDFYTVPRWNIEDIEPSLKNETVSEMRLGSIKNETTKSQKRDYIVSEMSTEIINSNKIISNNKGTGAKAPSSERDLKRDVLTKPEVSKPMETNLRNLEDLSDSELYEIEEAFKKHSMTYKEIQSKYNLNWKWVNSKIGNECNSIRYRRASQRIAEEHAISTQSVLGSTAMDPEEYQRLVSERFKRKTVERKVANKFSDLW